jgi:hypothetical protein
MLVACLNGVSVLTGEFPPLVEKLNGAFGVHIGGHKSSGQHCI